jgi:hypothetical protein
MNENILFYSLTTLDVQFNVEYTSKEQNISMEHIDVMEMLWDRNKTPLQSGEKFDFVIAADWYKFQLEIILKKASFFMSFMKI